MMTPVVLRYKFNHSFLLGSTDIVRSLVNMMADSKNPDLLYLIHSRPHPLTSPVSEQGPSQVPISSASQYESAPVNKLESEFPEYRTRYPLNGSEGRIDISRVQGGAEAVEFRQYQLVHNTSVTKEHGKSRLISFSGDPHC